MSTIVEASVSAGEFALTETLSTVPGAEFEVVRLVANGSDRVMPFLWGAADDLDELESALESDHSTQNVEVLTRLEDELLFQMEWMAHTRIILHILLEEQGTVLDAYGANDRWELRILFPEHDSISTTHEFCDDYDIEMSFDRVYKLSDSFRRGQYGLTDDQFETVMNAFENGYYEIPRRVKLTDLADDQNVTHQALSERLRRGHRTLIRNTLRPDVTEFDDA